MNKASTALGVTVGATALVFLVFAAGCQTGDEAFSGEDTAGGRTTVSEEVAEAPEAGTTDAEPAGAAPEGTGEKSPGATVSAGDGASARAGDAPEADEPGSAEGNLRDSEVTLRLVGDSGTSFSGTCTVRGEEKDISGQTPERFVYRLDGRELECRVRNTGRSVLEAVVAGEGQRSRISVTGGGDLRFTVSRSGFSSSVSS